MKAKSLQEVAGLCGGKTESREVVQHIIINSHQARDGALFFALQGENRDGHEFVREVLDRGGCAVVREDYGCGEGLIRVQDPLEALQLLAKNYLKEFDIPVVAITGSNGKTSTKDFTAAVLATEFSVQATSGNYNNEIGLPLTVLGLGEAHTALVVEMGMRGKGQIEKLTEICPPTIAVITNIGPVHLELLGSLDNIANAKGEILSGLPQNGVAILNGDDALVVSQAHKAPGKVVFFGENSGNQVQISGGSLASNMCPSFTVHWDSNSVPVELNVPGLHNIHNATAAISVGLELGISPNKSTMALKQAALSKMRLEVSKTERGVWVINDAYNASPASMKSAIDTAVSMNTLGRKVAVLGDMLELGVLSEQSHRQIGAYAARHFDELFFVGANRDIFFSGAQDESFPEDKIHLFQNNEEVSSAILNYIQSDDLVLVKGSRGVALEKVVDILLGDGRN